jgi:hypothetical protein
MLHEVGKVREAIRRNVELLRTRKGVREVDLVHE